MNERGSVTSKPVQKAELANMLIHADRCCTAVTTRRLRCLAEGLYHGKWKGGWQSGFIKERGRWVELQWREKGGIEEERTGNKKPQNIFAEVWERREQVITMTLTVIVTVIRWSLGRKTTNYGVILQGITHFSFLKNQVQVNLNKKQFFAPWCFQGSNLGFSKLASWEQRSSSWSCSYSHSFNSSSLYRNKHQQ